MVRFIKLRSLVGLSGKSALGALRRAKSNTLLVEELQGRYLLNGTPLTDGDDTVLGDFDNDGRVDDIAARNAANGVWSVGKGQGAS